MAWSMMRRATDDDRKALEQAATRFAGRHGISLAYTERAVDAVECELYSGRRDEYARLKRLWRHVVARRLGRGATGIAHGYVGFEIP